MQDYVYFIVAPDVARVKIGRSISPRARLAALQGGSPVRLELRGAIETNDAAALEAELHAHFAHLRTHGEWFEIDDKLEREMRLAAFNEELQQVARKLREKQKLAHAREWLIERLSAGPVRVAELHAEVSVQGFSWMTARRAADDLPIESNRVGFGEGSYVAWSLPSLHTCASERA